MAIKRALKTKKKESGISRLRKQINGLTMSDMQNGTEDIESGDNFQKLGNSSHNNANSNNDSVANFDDSAADILGVSGSKDATQTISEVKGEQSLGFLDMEFGTKQTAWQKLNPFSAKHINPLADRSSIVFSATESATKVTFAQRWFPWFDENGRMREEFKREMRILSRLRHPGT